MESFPHRIPDSDAPLNRLENLRRVGGILRDAHSATEGNHKTLNELIAKNDDEYHRVLFVIIRVIAVR